jgi:hypothetical protein
MTPEQAIQLIRELSPRNDDATFRAAVLEILESIQSESDLYVDFLERGNTVCHLMTTAQNCHQLSDRSEVLGHAIAVEKSYVAFVEAVNQVPFTAQVVVAVKLGRVLDCQFIQQAIGHYVELTVNWLRYVADVVECDDNTRQRVANRYPYAWQVNRALEDRLLLESSCLLEEHEDGTPESETLTYDEMLSEYIASMDHCGKSATEIEEISRDELDADIAAGTVRVLD